jgi:hypothetical protein
VLEVRRLQGQGCPQADAEDGDLSQTDTPLLKPESE